MPFWEATKQKKLVIQYCKTAKKYQHFPRPVSIFTGRRRDIEWREVSGKGTVFSFTIAHRGTPAFQGSEPYAIASVTLDVGRQRHRRHGQLHGRGAEGRHEGQAVLASARRTASTCLMWQPDKDAT